MEKSQPVHDLFVKLRSEDDDPSFYIEVLDVLVKMGKINITDIHTAIKVVDGDIVCEGGIPAKEMSIIIGVPHRKEGASTLEKETPLFNDGYSSHPKPIPKE